MGKPHRMEFRGKIISPGDNGNGYLFFYAYPGKKRIYVHRAVLAAFSGRMSRLQSNHRAGKKGGNKIKNLEWSTAKQNQRHSISTGLRSMKIAPEDVAAIRFFYISKPLGPNGTTSILAKIFGCGRKSIRMIGSRRTYSHVK